MTQQRYAPAQLWIGAAKILHTELITYLQREWCSQACGECTVCAAIACKQYYNLLWLSPEKQYTRAQLEPLFETISRKSEAQKRFFIILESADLLTPACANSLLKSLEEPPLGYHFILLTDRPGAVLATVASRCVVMRYSGAVDNAALYADLRALFAKPEFDKLKTFTTALESAQITEQETPQLLEALIQDFINAHASAAGRKALDVMVKAAEMPPMPGSAKLFWKNLYLQIVLVFDRV